MNGQAITSTHQNGSNSSNRGSRLSPWVCFLSILIFYLLSFFKNLHLELPQMARPPCQHVEMAAMTAATMAAVVAQDADALQAPNKCKRALVAALALA